MHQEVHDSVQRIRRHCEFANARSKTSGHFSSLTVFFERTPGSHHVFAFRGRAWTTKRARLLIRVLHLFLVGFASDLVFRNCGLSGPNTDLSILASVEQTFHRVSGKTQQLSPTLMGELRHPSSGSKGKVCVRFHLAGDWHCLVHLMSRTMETAALGTSTMERTLCRATERQTESYRFPGSFLLKDRALQRELDDAPGLLLNSLRSCIFF